jgi:hypothetical protein
MLSIVSLIKYSDAFGANKSLMLIEELFKR